MTRWQRAVVMLCLVAPSLATAVDSDPSWDHLMARLRAAEGIEASLVGFATGPSRQHVLYDKVIEQGDEARFQELLDDEHAVVRCVGLLALAQTKGRASIPTLRQYLCDRDTVGYLEFDMGSLMTVGECALKLLADRNWLDIRTPHDRVPLMSPRRLIGLYIETLANDAAAGAHQEAITHFNGTLKRTRLRLDLPTLRRELPSLADWQILKGLGRLKYPKAAREVLIACVADECLAPAARLAAGSALTRHDDPASLRALRVDRENLNHLEDARWGDVLVQTVETRRAYERHRQNLGLSFPRREPLSNRWEHIRYVITCHHPLALDDLMDPPLAVLMPEHVETQQTVVHSIIAISENLDRFCQPWSTYADTPFKLDQFIQQLRWLRRQMDEAEADQHLLLSKPQSAEIEANISRYTTR